jgi:hypothetical protein
MSQSPSPPHSDPGPPILTPDVVADDDALGEAVEAFVAADHEARERLSEIARYSVALRVAAEPSVWQLIVQVDELNTATWDDLAIGIARWAFVEGQKHAEALGLPPEGST